MFCVGCGFQLQEGTIFCSSCGQKIGEGVTAGETVKVDNSDELENLYKLARRAWDDGDNSRALKSYEQILSKDPDNWEPNFYVAYFSGMNALKNGKPGGGYSSRGGRVNLTHNYNSGIGSCINKIYGCLDTVFSLIEDIKDYDEQQVAIMQVQENVEMAASYLSGFVDSEYSRILNETSLYVKNANTGGAFQNLWKPNDQNRDSYKSEISKMLNLVESRKVRLVEVVGKRRIDEYWAAHQDEKMALDSERVSLSEQVAALEQEMAAIPGYSKAMELGKQLKLLQSEKSSLGMFKGKEKKAIQSQIDSLTQQLEQIKDEIRPAVESTKNRILSLESRIEVIDTELTKPR